MGTKDKFINEIYEKIRIASFEAMVRNLKKPVGRAPNPKLIEMSKWYNNLAIEDERQLQRIMKDAIDEAVFSFLCVLDRARSLEGVNFDFSLKNAEGMIETGDGEYLHDIYNFKIQQESS